MYKVFFVDDEAAMRQGIRENILWEDSGFALSGEAPDGEMALSLISEIRPDILITDVKMPFMDGIELSARVKKFMPWIKIIILSGHDEFEYAKRAITVGVEEYLLKPVTSERLLEVLNRVAAQIDQEQDGQRKLENLERLLNDARTFQVEKLLNDLVYGNVDGELAMARAAELGLPIEAAHYLVMQIEMHRAADQGFDVFKRARSWAVSVLGRWEDVIFFAQGTDRLVCVLKDDGPSDGAAARLEDSAFACAQAVKYAVERNTPALVSAAIGSAAEGMGGLPKSLADCDRARRCLNLSNQKRIVSVKDVSGSGFLPIADIDKLPILDKLRYGAKEDTARLLDNYFQSFQARSMEDGGSFVLSFMLMNYMFVDVFMAASKLIEEFGGVPGEHLEGFSDAGSLLETTSGIEDFKEILTGILEKAFDFRDERTGAGRRDIIAKAKAFMRNHYAEQDISLHAVAREANVSPNHFSTIFSQETGETFISTITKMRIDAAKNLLETTDMRTAEVGYSVGYNDTHYFSYVFKKHVGVSPTEYRKNLAEERVGAKQSL